MNDSSYNSSTSYPLHQLVFNNDASGVSKFLNQQKEDRFVPLKDHHGNTALHLAVMMGHKESAQILIKHEHPVNVKNGAGWTVLQEAISYGDRQTIISLFRALRKERKKVKTNQKAEIAKALASLGGDFYIEMNWDFQSWIPFVSRILPSDCCKIYRKGNQIRMDSTLEDFSNKRWVRGDLSYIINFEGEGEPQIFFLDNKKKVYHHLQRQSKEEKEASIEDSADISMSSDISDGSMKTTDLSIKRVTTGWIFSHEKTQKVGQFDADFYKMTGLILATRKRREHLSEEDVKKNKSIRDAFSRGEDTDKVLEECDTLEKFEKRKSLPPPEATKLTWKDYLSIPSGDSVCLGRKVKEKSNNKAFEATLGISTQFPIKLENLLPILEALGPKAKMFTKLRDFITLHLPPGFPVQIDIPIFPTVKATVSFPQFEFRDYMLDSLFTVPSEYKEMPDFFEKSNKTKKKPSKEKQVEKTKSQETTPNSSSEEFFATAESSNQQS